MRISDWSSDVCSSDLQLIDADLAFEKLSIGAARKPKVQRQRVQHGAGIRIGACQRIVMGGGEADVAATQKRVDRGVHHQRIRCRDAGDAGARAQRSEEHTSELQSLMRISYAVFCLNKKNTKTLHTLLRYTM